MRWKSTPHSAGNGIRVESAQNMYPGHKYKIPPSPYSISPLPLLLEPLLSLGKGRAEIKMLIILFVISISWRLYFSNNRPWSKRVSLIRQTNNQLIMELQSLYVRNKRLLFNYVTLMWVDIRYWVCEIMHSYITVCQLVVIILVTYNFDMYLCSQSKDAMNGGESRDGVWSHRDTCLQ